MAEVGNAQLLMLRILFKTKMCKISVGRIRVTVIVSVKLCLFVELYTLPDE